MAVTSCPEAMPGSQRLSVRTDEQASSLRLSVDALLPGLETGQRDYWSPDTRTALGSAGKWFLYFQTLAGWALSLLAVAGFSGIVKSR